MSTVQKGKIGVTTDNIFPVIKKFLYSCLLYTSDAADD